MSNKDKENRKARRRREQQEASARNTEAGPSNAGTPSSSKVEAQSVDLTREDEDGQLTNKESFAEADFIPFSFSDEEEEAVDEDPFPAREWDKGKGKARERDSGREYAGRKRKADEVELSRDDRSRYRRQPGEPAQRKAPWVADADLEDCTNVAELLHREVEAFINYISPTAVEDEIRSLMVALISRTVRSSFPDAEVLPFGSYETKLYLPQGDIDLVVYSKSMARSREVTVLHALARSIRNAGITEKVQVISSAKVPIIKFVTTHGHFAVDISINRENGVTAGLMVKRYLKEFPALRGLVLVMKQFLSQRGMNEVYMGGLGSYSIVCMAISFLQQHPKIRRGEIDASKNLGVLVMEFFELYGCYFNYQEVGISLRHGGTYFSKARRGWFDQRKPNLLSIEDPGDISNDIARSSFDMLRVRKSLAGAFEILSASVYQQADIISARRERRMVRLSDAHRAEDRSVLASVMGVKQETINYRRVVQELYDRGTLHQMLGISPQKTIPEPSPPKRQSRAAGKESVASAWGEADMDLSIDDGRTPEDDSDVEESRYEIEKRRGVPSKRRKMGDQRDVHTVYTTDDDEDWERPERADDKNDRSSGKTNGHALLVDGYDEDDGLSEEDAEYNLIVPADDPTRPAPRDVGPKRSYWLSKGVGLEG